MASSEAPDGEIAIVAEKDLGELLVLMRGYCDFYEVEPSDEALQALMRALIADPEREGLQLLARDGDGRAVGFATLYWSWSTARAGRIGVMNVRRRAGQGRWRGGAADRALSRRVPRPGSPGAGMGDGAREPPRPGGL
jgi:hypothetical protein